MNLMRPYPNYRDQPRQQKAAALAEEPRCCASGPAEP